MLNRTILGALVLALPIAIDVPRDTTGASGHATRVSIGGGVGAYALISRGCEGQVLGYTPVHYRDIGVDIDQQIVGRLHAGVRGGLLHEDVGQSTAPGAAGSATSNVQTNRYVNPYLSVEGSRAGIGVGWVGSRAPFMWIHSGWIGDDVVDVGVKNTLSGHLRLGGRTRYFSVGLMENVPLYSGGGYFDAGIGFQPHARVDSWVGLSGAGPYDGAGVALKTDWQLGPRVSLDVRARLGRSGGQAQNGVGLGITSRFGGTSGDSTR